MNKIALRILSIGALVFAASCSNVEPPKPVGPLPSERQLAWHDMEYYAFIHFNMNTFTDMEWGLGGESPEQFNPTELDTQQWARVAKEAGMKGIIITAKHHDGFCLWPTKTTEHSVKNSPWKNGQGDLIKDLSESCKEIGLKFGVYLSPWDRNHKDYGTPEYVADYHEQLRELLTNYGELFEVWFDGANGGSGYYGGANETRKIDNKTYYQWDKVTAMVRELQPNAVIFSDAGPDVRWVGNEEGWANETNWSIMRRDEIYPGWPRYVELRSGHEDGTHWLPAEIDVSIRPGWYYHASEDHQVKSLPHLLDIYYHSVGRNGNLLLNLPVDNRGLVHEKDVAQLQALRQQLDKDFAVDLAKGVLATASDVRGESSSFGADQANDGNPNTYWATNDSITQASLTLEFEQPTEVNRILLQEYIPLGQRVMKYTIAAEIDGRWKEITEQTTIGYKRILKFDTVEASKIKIDFLQAKGPLAISNLEVYRAPNLLVPPKISRSRDGLVNIEVPDKNTAIYYTLDGSNPTSSSTLYEQAFELSSPTVVKAVAVDPDNDQSSATATKRLDISKKHWKVLRVSSGNIEETQKVIDARPNTFWATEKEASTPQSIVIDLGQEYNLAGFTYLPMQARYPFGIITHYEFAVSSDARNWNKVTEGEFGNVVNNRIEQSIEFNPVKGRYIQLKGTKVHGEDFTATLGEIGVITK
ncbi:alpha-L-fucosidase [Flagellimonas myxillae]|uniref:alpha-L-fucosidase n=1 Tax=Flagellimonas myxillae TaxID=2942214 RepID=UPI00201F383F|nr:alpha-L-fucosidase [Muricauda myxillae]MCL6267100.1 alpha-L-fucosidase [Muricauda myxillae]